MKTQDFDDFIFGRKSLGGLMNTFNFVEVPEVQIPIRVTHLDRTKCYNQDGLCEEDNCRCDYRAEGAKEFNKIEQ